jgi:hypothetical protein
MSPGYLIMAFLSRGSISLVNLIVIFVSRGYGLSRIPCHFFSLGHFVILSLVFLLMCSVLGIQYLWDILSLFLAGIQRAWDTLSFILGGMRCSWDTWYFFSWGYGIPGLVLYLLFRVPRLKAWYYLPLGCVTLISLDILRKSRLKRLVNFE